jgi:hypothetical protein
MYVYEHSDSFSFLSVEEKERRKKESEDNFSLLYREDVIFNFQVVLQKKNTFTCSVYRSYYTDVRDRSLSNAHTHIYDVKTTCLLFEMSE